jgi:hypothetical protein
VVDLIIKNRGAIVIGRGGTGKSQLIKGRMDGDRQVIKGLVEAFEKKDLLTYVVALTHTAVANVTTTAIVASTLLAFLHRNMKRKKIDGHYRR